MGQKIQGGSGIDEFKVEQVGKLQGKIVLEEVEVIKRPIYIDIPKVKLVEVEYEKPIIREQEVYTTRYVTETKETVKFIPTEKETIKYTPKDVECERPRIVEKEYERPVIVEKEYEKPVVKEKEIEVVTIKDLEALKEFSAMVHEIKRLLPEVKSHLEKLREYRLIEQEQQHNNER